MSEHEYTRNEAEFGYDMELSSLSKEVESALPGKPFSVSANDGAAVFVFDDDLTGPETSTLNAVVAAHQTTVYLARLKAWRKSQIDLRTRELVTSGFSYNGRVFSTSETAQRNWEVLHSNRAELAYPFQMATTDNDEIYPVAHADELRMMYLTGLSTVMVHYQSGNALKAQIIAAANAAAVAAIVDDR